LQSLPKNRKQPRERLPQLAQGPKDVEEISMRIALFIALCVCPLALACGTAVGTGGSGSSSSSSDATGKGDTAASSGDKTKNSAAVQAKASDGTTTKSTSPQSFDTWNSSTCARGGNKKTKLFLGP